MSRFEIQIDVDESNFSSQASGWIDNTLRPALAEAVNSVADLARVKLTQDIDRCFDRPTPFTERAIGVLLANTSKAGDPEALVTVMPMQARYMALEIAGGERLAGDYATTGRGPITPGKGAQVDAFGNLPQGYVAAEVMDGAKWMTFNPSKGPVLAIHQGGRLQVIAVINADEHYDARFDFFGIVAEVAAASLPVAVADAISKRHASE